MLLRIHEPATGKGPWRVELLAQDRDEPSLVVPVADVFAGGSSFGPDVVVLDPPDLREAVIRHLKGVLA